MTEMPSPCVNICSLDKSGTYCMGCGRSLAEIAIWKKAGAAERQAIAAQLPERLKKLQS